MQRSATRRAVLTGVGAATLAGCIGDGPTSDPDGGAPSASPSSAPTSSSSGDDGGASDTGSDGRTGPPTSSDVLSLPMEPSALRDRAISGGPPKDGIPAIDDPRFIPAGEADNWMRPGDVVFGLAIDGEAKAYPQRILVWHEICNDVVDGDPVSVTYCPLTGTAIGFHRGETTFGVSGRLVNNNLVMYDRATDTWWPQILATSIPGPWNENPPTRSLREFRVIWTTWGLWSDVYPDTLVLSRDTGLANNYDSDPYGSYDPRERYYAPDAPPLFPPLAEDDRLAPKTVVIGARTPEGAVAVRKGELRGAGIVRGRLGDAPVVVAYDDVLDTGYLFRNPDDRRFERRQGAIVDEEGASYPPDALPLDRIRSFDAMWFAWSGFYPDTTLYA